MDIFSTASTKVKLVTLKNSYFLHNTLSFISESDIQWKPFQVEMLMTSPQMIKAVSEIVEPQSRRGQTTAHRPKPTYCLFL